MRLNARMIVFTLITTAITTIAVLVLLLVKHNKIAAAKAAEWERQQAVYKLQYQTLLLEIPENAPDEKVRWAIGIKDQTLLEEIARNDSSAQVRRVVVSHLKDQTLLAEIAKNEKEHVWVRIQAANNLTNQTALAEIAKYGKVGEVCVEALENLTDQALLLDIAKNSPNLWTRFSAARRLNDKALGEKLRTQTDELITEERRLQSLLAEIGLCDDQEQLAEIAEEDKREVIRQAAKARLNELKK